MSGHGTLGDLDEIENRISRPRGMLGLGEAKALIAEVRRLRAENAERNEWERENLRLKLSALPDSEEFLKWDCDAGEALADEILRLRAENADLRGVLDVAHQDVEHWKATAARVAVPDKET